MMIQGQSCTLTVAKDDNYYPLPYSEETVRTQSKGYALPGVIGKRNREKFIVTGITVEGCFVTRLEYQTILSLFLLLFYSDEHFDLLADRICEKTIYKNINVKAFELRAENKKPFYFRLDVTNSEDTYTTNWKQNTPALNWNRARTFYYDGHNVTADNKTLPLVYRFELIGKYDEKSKYELTLYFPLDKAFYPSLKNIQKLSINIDTFYGITLDLYDLKPNGSLTDINCADTVLCSQKFIVESNIVFTIRNENQFTQVVL